ncbi:MAG TPA: oxalurate catabolism protein HpxZ [Burkholderiaceae bacterium]|nr:oxalurate catabolism protein HpxZ [Burkholderiaceae bacterium]
MTTGMTADQLNQPEVLAEIRTLFDAYEHALMTNDVDALLGFFWPDPALTRYGIADRQLGYGEMVAFRHATPAPTFTRSLHNLRITSFGADCAVAHVEFRRSDSTLLGMQTQTWVRLPQGWKIVSAHVSMVDLPA